ncbi:hypothetical protein ACQPZZ_37745 [Microbispora sp. CA-135349]|uniref:hypothetical protein n=1 Tax=Microbispora sp. CA-135349 TaxID=3239953 RepID=UPI003D91DE75
MNTFTFLGGLAVSVAFLPVAMSSAAQADVAPVAPAPMERPMATAPRAHEPARVSTPTILPRYTAFRRFTARQPRQWRAGWDPFAEQVFGPEMQLQLEPGLAREAARETREARRAEDLETMTALFFYLWLVQPPSFR